MINVDARRERHAKLKAQSSHNKKTAFNKENASGAVSEFRGIQRDDPDLSLAWSGHRHGHDDHV